MTEKKSFPKERTFSQDIKNDDFTQKWLNCYKESERKGKLSVLQKYCNFTKKTPTELILEHKNDIYRDNPLDIENIAKKQMLKFFEHLKKIISFNSARQYVFSRLAAFYKRNNVPVNFDKKETPQYHPKGTIDKVWRNGKEERIKEANRIECLKQIRDSFPHLRDKAIFLVKLSSGLDDVDLFNLKIKNFNEGMIGEFDICYVNGNRIKTDVYYQTFFNSEAIRMIELYLKERKAEKYEDYLFVSNKGTKCKPNTFSEAMKIVCRKLSIKNITPKSLRRYFNTTLKHGKIDFEILERLLGHKVDISKGSAYDEILNDDYRFAKYYSDNVESLTLLGNRNQRIPEVEELKKRVAQLEATQEILIKQFTTLRTDYPKVFTDIEKMTFKTAKKKLIK